MRVIHLTCRDARLDFLPQPMAGNGYAILNLFDDLDLSIFFAQKHPRRKKGDLHFASKCIIFALQERRCYPDR